jgi:NAD(P)-dependent dehydrogenase (short-subunit alcohol dehydrogenase family)
MVTRTIDPNEIDFKSKFDLSGKWIVITGACGLIGKAFCEAVAQFGASVIVVDIEASEPKKFANDLSVKHQREMIGLSVDVSNKESVKQLLNKILKKTNRIDGLVNGHQNKSHLIFEKFEELNEDNWDKVVEVNLKGTFLTCQIIGTYMALNGGGKIVNLPSTYSLVAPNQNLYKGTNMGCPAAYSASKGGVEALSKYLASYWASKNIQVNMITPHGVWNEHEKQFEENFSNFTPMQRMSYNHEVSSALIYLLSEASSYVTGDNMLVEGGWTVW